MSYYKKYLKYKTKYFELKNQTGGNYILNLEEWTQIEIVDNKIVVYF